MGSNRTEAKCLDDTVFNMNTRHAHRYKQKVISDMTKNALDAFLPAEDYDDAQLS